MNQRTRVPLSVWSGLAIAILLDTGVQICWKMAAKKLPESAGMLGVILQAVHEPLAWAVVILSLLQLANWLKVLGKADLSYAQPITSLSYVSVCIASVLLLDEKVTLVHSFGILLILIGVWFISRSEHQTAQEVME